ncbi:MAG: hypothetical protein K2M68_07825 [Muribaculaceae bacterium]|nr:hypothetical protein [Muribaculaceae bacterium]
MATDRPLVIMGNGPSLNSVFDHQMDVLKRCDCMAVNFAANTERFFEVKPRYYTLADPHFFKSTDDSNITRLIDSLEAVDWAMTLFVPTEGRAIAGLLKNSNITVATYNAVGLEGWQWFTHKAFTHQLGMPRPRNVLIPSIMLGIWLGYKEIYLTGADHSWTTSLSVDENNNVITNLPHFYADNNHEQERVKAVYAGVPLHNLFHSYYVAFKAYHEIEQWARERGAVVYNSTPGSFIDAFERRELPL